jgi:hypothetical protein
MPKGNSTHSIAEHLIDVGVESYTLVLRRGSPAIPIAERLEGVVDQLQGVRGRRSERRV